MTLPFTDLTDPAWGAPAFPLRFTSFRDHQIPAIEQIVGHFQDGMKTVIVDAPVGCLSGDTEIRINRAGKGFRLPLRDLVHRFNGGETPLGRGLVRTTTWNPSIETRVQRCMVTPKYGYATRLAPLVRAISSGVKTTYVLTTKGGRTIRATEDHRFLLDGGMMVPLKDLRVGDDVLVDQGKGGRGGPASRGKPRYSYVQGLVNHPSRGAWPYRQPVHRLVLEAELNDLPLDWYVAILRDAEANTSVFEYLSPAVHVHHRDHDGLNNQRSNLEVLEGREHLSRHGTEGQWANVANRIGPDRVVSIVEFDEEETFDLTVLDEPHNFIANEFVVENSGKTLIGEAVRRGLGNVMGLYTATTKTLQDQVLSDYPYAKVLKGRGNYPTLSGSNLVTAADCTYQGPSSPCDWCEIRFNCPYEEAKREALAARLAVINTSYFLTEANGPGRFGGDNGRPLVILDEADSLEGALLSFVEVDVGPWWLKKLRMKPPGTKTEEAKANDWVDWVDEALEKVQAEAARLPIRTSDPKSIRYGKRVRNLAGKLAMLAEQLPEGGWVYQGYERDDPRVTFKPVKVDKLADQYLWRHGKRFLLMSGSVISADEVADSLGIEDFETVTVDVDWDNSRRPIYVAPVADVTWKNKKKAYPALKTALEAIVEEHAGERVLVHTVNYDLSRYLSENVRLNGRPVVSYTNAAERMDALETYKTTDGAVIIASSLDRGIDLPDDLCSVIVICKVPFPPLGDKQVSKRLHSTGRSGKVWYRVQVVRSIVQMVGRGFRHENDQVTVYILDRQMESNILAKSSRLLPRQFRDAIVDDLGEVKRVKEMLR